MKQGAQPRLKRWGGPRFGSQHRVACAPCPAKGRAGCWVWEGVAPSRCVPPENFLKTQMLNPAFWWLLAVKFLAFWKLRPRSWGDQFVGLQPKRLGDQSPPVPKVVAPMQWRQYGGWKHWTREYYRRFTVLRYTFYLQRTRVPPV